MTILCELTTVWRWGPFCTIEFFVNWPIWLTCLCNIPTCTISHHPIRANVNTCLILICPWVVSMCMFHMYTGKWGHIKMLHRTGQKTYPICIFKWLNHTSLYINKKIKMMISWDFIESQWYFKANKVCKICQQEALFTQNSTATVPSETVSDDCWPSLSTAQTICIKLSRRHLKLIQTWDIGIKSH